MLLIRQAAAAFSFLIVVLVVGAEAKSLQEIDTRMADQEARWIFVGSEHPWKQRKDGVILSPIWGILGEADAPRYFERFGSYADDLTREDYAFLSDEILSDLDLSVDFQIRSGSVTNMGIGLRAQDGRRMYCVQVKDMGRKGFSFHVSLWLQDAAGFRTQLASGIVPHPETPDRIRQRGPRNHDDWVQSSHGWSTLRVRALANKIDVSIDGHTALTCEDSTYAAGTVALIARWAIPFRNFQLRGKRADLPRPWRPEPKPMPDFFLPFDGRIGSFEGFPAAAQDSTGRIYVVASVGENAFSGTGIGIVTSTDSGKTWTDPQRFDDLGKFATTKGAGHSPSLYAHQDGRLSCFFRHRPSMDQPETIAVAESTDHGRSWSAVRELVASGKPVSTSVESGQISLYSPVQRLKNRTLLLSGYHYDAQKGGDLESNANRLDRSVIFRSTDDGATWTGPHYLSQDNFDNNECMIAELPDGRLQAFMRTLKAPSMWTSFSLDGGLTWSQLTQSGVAAECPSVLGHSSGTIVLGNRGAGIFLNISRDGARTWDVVRVSPASGMMGMTELPDGRILIVYHTGYRVPGRIRAQLLSVTSTGIEPARAFELTD